MNHLNNVRLRVAKIRFAQWKFSLCPNTAARKKRGKGKPVVQTNSKATFHIITSLWVVFGLSTPNFKNVSKSGLFQTQMEDIQQHLSSWTINFNIFLFFLYFWNSFKNKLWTFSNSIVKRTWRAWRPFCSRQTCQNLATITRVIN